MSERMKHWLAAAVVIGVIAVTQAVLVASGPGDAGNTSGLPAGGAYEMFTIDKEVIVSVTTEGSSGRLKLQKGTVIYVYTVREEDSKGKTQAKAQENCTPSG